MTKARSVALRVALAAGILLVIGTCTGDHQPTSPPAAPEHDVTPLAATGPIPTEVLVGAGNIARCDGTSDEATKLLLDGIAGTVFAAGDNVKGKGTLQEYNGCYGPSWGWHKARTRPTPGDVDYKTAGAAGYFDYFGTSAGDRDKGYYSYNLGAWHVMVLNSNISMAAGAPQEQWLRGDLAANTRQCTVAYWHQPRFSTAGGGVNTSVKPLWDALYASRTDVVVNAHYQFYERFAPQTPDGVGNAVQRVTDDPVTGLNALRL